MPAAAIDESLLSSLAGLCTYVIVAAFALHLALFFWLWLWARRDLKQIASALFDFTRGINHQSILDSTAHLSDQIDAFLADVNDVLDDTSRVEDRSGLLRRMSILDEKRRYLSSMSFETIYNAARTMIEAYPLAGILGTILAIGAALQQSATISAIVARFGDAIWSTGVGLMAAIVLLFVHSLLEPRFSRLSENRLHVRETVARAKRELSFHNPQSQQERG
ncbi:MAG: MotA/TolQ/ExbB proton channel [Planctomycetota bacterium]|nr:MAG: MotA/TolQ/ExbB proton channel [Planctomycetota bacterium]REJ89262.1 MAG: MotA/TolQ/ExbB proton channel [Planctomycetota bacterium]REK29325.1 MAG: MotA/TolQ/ExbB proton channel [Planctomycetota bacterium]REK35940.1 MAG: MotA/TolQ/ExbB proton channel [Planctomycetota bacterium]